MRIQTELAQPKEGAVFTADITKPGDVASHCIEIAMSYRNVLARKIERQRAYESLKRCGSGLTVNAL